MAIRLNPNDTPVERVNVVPVPWATIETGYLEKDLIDIEFLAAFYERQKLIPPAAIPHP